MPQVDSRKLLEFAVMIEKKGERFFRHWAEKAETEEHKKLFRFLADEEALHVNVFKDMLEKSDIETRGAAVRMPADYGDYFNTFSQEILFNEEELENHLKGAAGLSAALDFAIKQELDSLLFYADLVNFVPKEHVEAVKAIREEERKHFVSLSRLKEKLT